MTTDASQLQRTPLHQIHIARSAKMVDFAGWEMPLHYGSIIDEHKQVRRSGGLFDVSHMGRFRFSGRDARAFLDRVCTRQIWGMQDGQARYSIICNDRGGCRDDVLVYRRSDTDYTMVCNASNRAKLVGHFDAVKGDMVFKFDDYTEQSAMLAIQGPKVIGLMGDYTIEIPKLKRFHFTTKNVLGLEIMFARTGYTGEDGVEIIFRTDSMIAGMAIKRLFADFDTVEDVIRPAGLGARDSLRLEAGMALYGHEISEDLDPISAGLNFAIRLDKGEDSDNSPAEVGRFIGQDALQTIAANGPARRLVGLVLEGRRAARQGMTVQRDGTDIGTVTSGCLSPTLEKSIAMAYVDSPHAETGNAVQVAIGAKTIDAEVVPLPFYKAPK